VTRTAGKETTDDADGASGIHVGSLFGVRLIADWSVLIIFALILVNLGVGVLPNWHPDWPAWLVWSTALAAALLFFASIVAHELSHALVARRNGIPVRRITLFLFGGMAHMEREPPTPRAEFLMAAAGPLMSLAIGVAATVTGALLAGDERFAAALRDDPAAALRALGPLTTLLLWLGPINVLLAVFNIIPGFPLDGGRVLRALLWSATGDMTKATRWASRAGQGVAWALMAWGAFALLGGASLQGIWLLLIGWFLNNAARQSYRQLLLRESLRDVPLERVMRTRFRTLPPDVDLDRLVREELMAADQRAFPVVADDGRLVGLVCLEDVRKVPHPRWGETRVAAIMTPLDRLATLAAGATAPDALELLGRRGVDQIPVVEDGRPVGLVRSQDLVTFLSLHASDDARRALGPLAR
jgi:Zn-dependent protease